MELPFPSPGNLPDPGIEPTCPALGGRFFIAEPPEKPKQDYYSYVFQKIHPRTTIPKYFQRGSYPNVHYIALYSYNRIHNNENKCSLVTLISIEGSHKHNADGGGGT